MDKIKNISISESLRKIISEFKDKSLVASLLLEEMVFEDTLVPNHIDYLSASHSDKTKISYLTPERFTKINESEIWSTSKRYHSKPGSLISKIYRNITPREVENFSNLYRAFSDQKEFEFSIVKGSDIAKYYHQDTYAGSGSLGNSCMKYDRCSKFLDIYSDNNIISMLIMKNDCGGLIGRALLWEVDGQKVMDRIYTINDEDYQYYFMKWADNNGFIYKKRQNWANTLQFVSNGKDIESEIEIQLNKWDYSYYPYLDTFKWLDRSAGKLFNYKPKYFTDNTSEFCILMNAEGSSSRSSSLEFDVISKDWHHQGNLQYVEYCDLYTQRDNLRYSETLDQWILNSDSEYSEELRDNIFKDLSKVDIELIEKRKEYIIKLEEQEKERQNIYEEKEKLLTERLRNAVDVDVSTGRLRFDDYFMRYIQNMPEWIVSRNTDEPSIEELPQT
jgi:hypothetical protein